MPIRWKFTCPHCSAVVTRTPQGRCAACGAEVALSVREARSREERIERIVAVIGTGLVLLVFGLTAGIGLIEGALAYAGVGAVVLYLARRTFH